MINININQETPWKRALNAARRTVGKEPLDKEPSDKWKDSILYAEHSPIRQVEYDIQMEGIPNFVSVHLVRHHEGCEKFVHSNREDRGGADPNTITRLTPVDMDMTCNAQALINISRKRLCNCASKETREVWQATKDKMKEIDPIMAKHMVRECVYRGFCPELKCCGFVNTSKFQEELSNYRTKIQ